MKQSAQSNWLTTAGLLLGLPTAYFICISILKYQLNVPGPFDAIAPLLESMGIKETIGWNINLLILFGPMIGCALALLQVLKVNWQFTGEEFNIHIKIHKYWFPLFVAAFCSSVLAILFFYVVGENCNC